MRSSATSPRRVAAFAAAMLLTMIPLMVAGQAGAAPPWARQSDPELCKNGGWQNYPSLGFKNQGQCVSFVVRGGTLPSGPPPATTTLAIDKTGPSEVSTDQQVEFTMTVENTGPNPANDVVITDTLPSSGAFVSSTPPGTPASPSPGDLYTIPLGTIASGSSAQATLRWTAPSAPGSITNSARASAANAPQTSASTATVNVVSTAPATTTLTVDKTGPIAAFPGQEFDFAVTVTNTGSITATGVTVVDTLPSNGSFVSSTPPGVPASPSPGDIYTIGLGDIAPGADATATIRWQAPEGEGTIENSAIADASNADEVGPATATVSYGVGTSCNPCGVTAAGTGLRNRSQGTIEITGVPDGAVVERAVLVWAILHDGTIPPDTVDFEGDTVAADLTATPSGNLCWGDTGTIGYAADVTEYVTGNGSYVVSDPPRGETRVDDNPVGALPLTDGASLFVFFVGGGANDQVISDFTFDTNTDTDGRIDRSFSGINSVGGPASLIMAGPDGQNNGGETFTITGAGSPIVLNDTWDGSDPQDGPSFPIGNLWDTDVYDVSSVLPAGQTTLTFDHTLTGDCIGVSAAVLRVSQTPS
jgi:uncharacterized repeat protein (TIGR01451 family)